MSMGGYPLGAEYDPNAPWNEREDWIEIVEINRHGDIDLIKRTYIAEDDWDDETNTIDSYDMDKFLCEKLKLDFKKIEAEGEGIEILSLEESKNGYYIITTHFGIIKTSFEELYML